MVSRKKRTKHPEDRHPFFDQLEQLWRNKTAVAGMVAITFFALTGILAPVMSPHNPIDASLYDQIKPPIWSEGGSLKNILGTDDLGRDILSRLIYGARVSLLVAVATVGIGVVFGSFLGAIAGYYKGFLDNVIMRFMDILLAFPHILLAIVIMAYLGPGLTNA
ncbi:MAG: ABC transporter permease subunit, partial [Syntrophobacterales bacterium]